MGTLGIMHPPGVHGPVHKCHRLYFTDEFLHHPPIMWTVTPPPPPPVPESLKKAGWNHIGWIPWPQGTLIKYDNGPIHAVWLLSGRDFPLTQCHVYEGRWHD